MSTQEQWRSIPGFPDYEVSSLGRVVSHRRGAPRERRLEVSNGYLRLRLPCPGRKRGRWHSVHGLVATAFHGPRPSAEHEVRHLNGNPLDNRVGNLRWGTPSENSYDTVRHGRHREASKTFCANGHLFDEQNTRITPQGVRICRACHRAHNNAAYHRRSFRAAGLAVSA